MVFTPSPALPSSGESNPKGERVKIEMSYPLHPSLGGGGGGLFEFKSNCFYGSADVFIGCCAYDCSGLGCEVNADALDAFHVADGFLSVLCTM